MARECPDKQKRACYSCGSKEHMARDCPDKKSKGNDFYKKDSDT